MLIYAGATILYVGAITLLYLFMFRKKRHDSMALNELREWQTSIAGFVGFFGVILAILFGQQQEIARQEDEQRLIDVQTSYSTNAAVGILAAEITFLLESVVREVSVLDEIMQEGAGSADNAMTIAAFMLTASHSHRTMALDQTDITLLNAEVAYRLFDFHTSLEGYRRRAKSAASDIRSLDYGQGVVASESDFVRSLGGDAAFKGELLLDAFLRHYPSAIIKREGLEAVKRDAEWPIQSVIDTYRLYCELKTISSESSCLGVQK